MSCQPDKDENTGACTRRERLEKGSVNTIGHPTYVTSDIYIAKELYLYSYYPPPLPSRPRLDAE